MPWPGVRVSLHLMRRSKWKRLIEEKENPRNQIIDPSMINKEIEIHNGKDYKKIKITIDHIGHRLGEFNNSKKTPRYKKNVKKN